MASRAAQSEFAGWYEALDRQIEQCDWRGAGHEPRLTSLWLIQKTQKEKKELLGSKEWLLGGREYYEECVGNAVFQIKPKAFFQVNPLQTRVLYDEVVKCVGIDFSGTLIDLYCGTGAIGLYTAKQLNRKYSVQLIGIDHVSQGIEQAKINAKRNGLSDCSAFYKADSEVWLRRYASARNSVCSVIVDPPRSGLSKGIVNVIKDLSKQNKLQKLVYISCNPSTLARDVQRLSTHWKVEKVQPVDMFPWTSHVETVVLFSK